MFIIILRLLKFIDAFLIEIFKKLFEAIVNIKSDFGWIKDMIQDTVVKELISGDSIFIVPYLLINPKDCSIDSTNKIPGIPLTNILNDVLLFRRVYQITFNFRKKEYRLRSSHIIFSEIKGYQIKSSEMLDTVVSEQNHSLSPII